MDEHQECRNAGYTQVTAKTGVLLLLALIAAYLLTASGRIDSGDGLIIFAVSQNLLERGDVTVDPPDPDRMVLDAQGRPLGMLADLGIEDGYSVLGRSGRYYSPTAVGQSIMILPLLALGRLAALTPLFGPPQWTVQFITSLLFNPLVTAVTALLVFLTGRRFLFLPATNVVLTLIYAFGTMTWIYAKSFFSDPLTTLSLLLAFYSLVSYRATGRCMWLWSAGAGLAMAILTKPASLLNAPILAVYLIAITRYEPKRAFGVHILAFMIPLLLGLLGVMAYNWWRFESPLDTGYRNMGWTFPFFQGLYGLTLSPGKGYLLYNPITFAALIGMPLFRRHHQLEFWAIVGLVAVNLGFLASYSHWPGGGCWGPRLLLPITPFIILPLGSLIQQIPRKSFLNLPMAILIVLSILIQLPGVSVGYGRFLQKVYAESVEEYHRRITFEVAYSPLLGQWSEMREVFGNLRDPDRRAALSKIAFEEDADLSRGQAMELLSTNLPDFWFVYLSFVRHKS